MIKPRSPAFERTCDYDDIVVSRRTPVKLREVTRERLCQIEIVNIFCLAEIKRVMQF